MRERLVYCGGTQPSRDHSSSLQLSLHAPKGSSQRINLRIEDLTAALADNIPDELTDMLELATYVYCADQLTGRGTTRMAGMGSEWRRKFRFIVPVRSLSMWQNPELRDALTTMLAFLSEDEFAFEFVQARNPVSIQYYFGFREPAAQTIRPEEVILFSGGLDSLAGAVDTILGRGQPALLVSHQASKMIASRQNSLAAELRGRAPPQRIFHLAVSVNKGPEEAADFTQRTRSLLFASLGFVAAKMFDLNSLRFFENGVVSINLPVAEHVLGARASRTTHPRFLRDCSKLFSLLTSTPFEVQNPYIWKTKADVVRVLKDHDCADLVSKTVSCTRVRHLTKHGLQCGVCSQCVDRRFGILAANSSLEEPSENYSVDLFRGAHEPGSDLTLIESYVNMAQKLATMSELAFVTTYGQIYRAVPHLRGAVDQNINRLWDMHRRHGRDVVSVIDRQLTSMNMAALSALPPTSLLAMIMSKVAERPVYVDPVEREPIITEKANADSTDYTTTPIHFAVDHASRRVFFDDGIWVEGAAYELIAALLTHGPEDRPSESHEGMFPFIRATDLADKLKIEETSLRRRIYRARLKLQQRYLKVSGRELGLDDVIENQERVGYRLNPFVLMVPAAQLRHRPSTRSQAGRPHVTSSRQPH